MTIIVNNVLDVSQCVTDLQLGVPKGPWISFPAHLEGGLNNIMGILVAEAVLRINFS